MRWVTRTSIAIARVYVQENSKVVISPPIARNKHSQRLELRARAAFAPASFDEHSSLSFDEWLRATSAPTQRYALHGGVSRSPLWWTATRC